MAWEPNYINRDQLKNFLSEGQAGMAYTKDDEWIDRAISAGARAIDDACSPSHRRGKIRRQFGLLTAAEARYYTPYWSEPMSRWVCEIDDVTDTAGMVVAIDTDGDDVHETTITDYLLRPRDSASLNRPFTQLVFARDTTALPVYWSDSVKITVRWGWSPTWPSTIEQANLLQSSRFYVRRVSPFGVKGSPDDDSEEELQYKLDPDVLTMLEPYRRDVETLP